MIRNHWTLVCCVLAIGMVLPALSRARADTYAEVEGAAHAKGFVVLRGSFPPRGEVSGVSLRFSTDGETFEMSQAGLPRHYRLLHSIVYEPDRTTVIVTVVGRFTFHEGTFLFDEPGRYWLRWGVNFKNKDLEPIRVDQTVEVGRARRSDLDVIARLSDPQFIHDLLGKDFLDRQTGNALEILTEPSGAGYRWSLVVRRLLRATQSVEAVEGEHKSADDFARWTGMMFHVAQEFPESSYAPYAAFYAGSGYVSYLCEVLYKDDVGSDAIRKDELAQKAEKALNLAVDHGDSYLRPRAILQQARLHALTGAWGKAEQLLRKSLDGPVARGTIRDMADKLRRDITRAKERLPQPKYDVDK